MGRIRVDPLGSSLTAQDPWYPLVTDVEVHGRNVYVAGNFDHAGATVLANVGRWDGTRWNPLGSGLAPNLYEGYWDTIRLAFFDGHLWAGGGFLAAGGKQSAHVACWSEPVVPIEVAGFEALAAADEVRLRWRLSAAAAREISGVHVERAPAAAGPYTRCTTTPLSPAPVMEFADPAPPTPEARWYRLVLENRAGATSIAGPLAVQVDATRTLRTALEPPFEPADGGPIQIRYSLATAEPALRLGLYDVRGRQVWASVPAALVPGRYTRGWDRRDQHGARVPRGVYFLRLETTGTSPVCKLRLTRP